MSHFLTQNPYLFRDLVKVALTVKSLNKPCIHTPTASVGNGLLHANYNI